MAPNLNMLVSWHSPVVSSNAYASCSRNNRHSGTNLSFPSRREARPAACPLPRPLTGMGKSLLEMTPRARLQALAAKFNGDLSLVKRQIRRQARVTLLHWT